MDETKSTFTCRVLSINTLVRFQNYEYYTVIFNHNSFVWRAQNLRFSNVSAAWNSLISSLFPLICNFSNVKRGINNMQPTVSLWQGVRMVSHRELLSARRLPVWEKIYLINDHRHNLRNAMKNFCSICC